MTDQTKTGPEVPQTGAATAPQEAPAAKPEPAANAAPEVEAPKASDGATPAAGKAERPRLPLPKLSKPTFSMSSLPRPNLTPLAALRRHGALAAGLALGVALGGAAGAGTVLAWTRHADGPTAADWARIAQRLEETSPARAGADVKALREQVAALKEASDRGRSEAATRLAQMGERIEKIQRTEQEVAKGVAALSDRIERADRDEAQRLASLGDRIEKRLAAAPAQPQPQAAAKPADPVQTGAIPGAPPQPAVVTGWILREVYDGMAMLENRNQRLLEVAPGSTVPGVGRVEAIERRGKGWVVVTAKGLITAQAW